MKTWVKVLLWLIGAAVVVWVVAILTFRFYLTRERIIEWVKPSLQRELKRKVTIREAGAGLTGFFLGDLVVLPDRQGEPPPLTVELVTVRWRLLPLLWGTLVLERIVLERPQVMLLRRPDGSFNLGDLEQRARQGPPLSGHLELLRAVEVVSLRAGHGQLTYRDLRGKQEQSWIVQGIELDLEDLTASRRPLRFDLRAHPTWLELEELTVQGTAEPAQQTFDARIRLGGLALPSLGPALPGELRFASGKAGADLRLRTRTGRVFQLQGTVQVEQLALASAAGRGEPTDVLLELRGGGELLRSRAELERAELKIAGQQLTFEGRLERLSERPLFVGEVSSARLQLQPLLALLPPPEPSAAPPRLPLEAQAQLQVDELDLWGVKVRGVTGEGSLQQGVLQLRPLGGTFYGGTLTARLRCELQRPGTPVDGQVTCTDAQLGELLADLNPELGQKTTGLFTLQLQGQSQGLVPGTVRGTLRVEARDGRLGGWPVMAELARLFQTDELASVKYRTLSVDARAAEGSLQLRKLELKGPEFQATSQGVMDLPTRTLAVRLEVMLPRETAARAVSSAWLLHNRTDARGRTTLPLELTGTLSQPRLSITLRTRPRP